MDFKLHSKYKPSGDQPQAIDLISKGIEAGIEHQTVVGATGTGKTFTVANIIEKFNRPTIIISHNKTLAAQLFSEFTEFFPENEVAYFVSYYDYYQPEAYVPSRDLYIEKDSDINETIEKYRNTATQALLSRRDVIIVASVSCIYGLGNPSDYIELSLKLKVGDIVNRDKLSHKLIDMQYERRIHDFPNGSYRVRGEIIDINLTTANDEAVRLEFFGEEIEAIKLINPISGELIQRVPEILIFPAKHYATPQEKLKGAIEEIRTDLEKEVKAFSDKGQDMEANRLRQRVNFDLEMLQETGFTKGIENYSRYFDKRPPGSSGSCLLDYFPDDYLMFIDESHITVPQVGGMYSGDRARKQNLVDYGFRLKAAMDNRPLKFEEFQKRINQAVYLSATPKEYELEISKKSTKKALS
ncbi:MAG: DEAD/DEAH box helicase family protein [Candidatus Dojkabacteria bacterium]|nr:DEAD/DEAH box helicase family protein [Candidatus Dojkabacteria bacterium]MDQ7021850.1 DEAD/DEAH box helicase family protein [Candidatus Dojkabacteria bacterium]